MKHLKQDINISDKPGEGYQVIGRSGSVISHAWCAGIQFLIICLPDGRRITADYPQ